MPKKTRQEKLLAQLKRLQQQQQNPDAVTTSTNSQSSNQPVISLNLKSLETSPNTQNLPQRSAIYDYAYVYTDLRKTLIFAVLAVIFEFALSRFV